MFYHRLEPVRGTYDALISSGQINLIRSSAIRAQLAKLFGTMGHGFEDAPLADRMGSELLESFAEVGVAVRMMGAEARASIGLRPIDEPQPLDALLTNNRFLSALTGVAFPEFFTLEAYFRPLREDVVATIEMLHAERGR